MAGAEVDAPTVVATVGHRGATKWRRWLAAAGLLAALAGAATAAALITLAWQSERSGKHRAQRQLNASQVQLAQARASLAATRKQLATTQALTQRQAAILARTAVVLRKVDPLFTDVDRLQGITSSIETSRNTFSTDAGQLVDDLVTLGNDLLDVANIYGLDVSYLQNEIDIANSEIATVRGEATTLSSDDSQYTGASRTFGNHADDFASAVRQLQRELRKLPRR